MRSKSVGYDASPQNLSSMQSTVQIVADNRSTKRVALLCEEVRPTKTEEESLRRRSPRKAFDLRQTFGRSESVSSIVRATFALPVILSKQSIPYSLRAQAFNMISVSLFLYISTYKLRSTAVHESESQRCQ